MRLSAVITLFVFSPLLLSFASAQQAANSAQTKSVPLPHLYWHLLEWQNHLDSTAAAHEKNGQDGTWLRTYLQNKLRFTDSEFAPVRASAQHLKAALASLDAQAQPLIKADRALYAQGVLAKGDPLPDLAQYKALDQQRETAITDEVAQLNAALGPTNSARLQTFIQKSFSTNVKTITITSQVLHKPSQSTLGPASAHTGVQP